MLRFKYMLLAFAAGSLLSLVNSSAKAQRVWPNPTPPVVEGSNGYVEIPLVSVKRDPDRHYKAIFSMNKGPSDPTLPLAQLKRAAFQLNGLKLARVPDKNISFAIIVYGDATDALLNDIEYQNIHKINNPNKTLIKSLQKNGVSIYVCSQHMASHNIKKSSLLSGVNISEAATLVMITFSNDGYALITD